MLTDQQIEQVLHKIASAQRQDDDPVRFGIVQKDKSWLAKMFASHSITLIAAILTAAFVFSWNTNDRLTRVEINQQYTHDVLTEVRSDVSETKHQVYNLSARLMSTRQPGQEDKR